MSNDRSCLMRFVNLRVLFECVKCRIIWEKHYSVSPPLSKECDTEMRTCNYCAGMQVAPIPWSELISL
jgi:hypothetical protein